MADTVGIAANLAAARHARREIPTPSSQDPAFDMASGYAVEAELTRRRRAGGARTVGWKVGYANRAMWRALKLDTLVWAHMYDDTVRYAAQGASSLSIEHLRVPKIEPEIVVKLKGAPASTDAAAVLESVEWLAVGFEIIDCPFPDWTFQPADFAAAFGLHAGLVVGAPLRVAHENIPALIDALPRLTVRLMKDGELVDEGSGKNALKSPASCVGELSAAMSRRAGSEMLQAGDLISTGTLTASQPIAPGETWTATVEGLQLSPLTLGVV